MDEVIKISKVNFQPRSSILINADVNSVYMVGVLLNVDIDKRLMFLKLGVSELDVLSKSSEFLSVMYKNEGFVYTFGLSILKKSIDKSDNTVEIIAECPFYAMKNLDEQCVFLDVSIQSEYELVYTDCMNLEKAAKFDLINVCGVSKNYIRFKTHNVLSVESILKIEFLREGLFFTVKVIDIVKEESLYIIDTEIQHISDAVSYGNFLWYLNAL